MHRISAFDGCLPGWGEQPSTTSVARTVRRSPVVGWKSNGVRRGFRCGLSRGPHALETRLTYLSSDVVSIAAPVCMGALERQVYCRRLVLRIHLNRAP